jgi:DNA-binding SARP family transcriptional activator
MSGAGQDSFGLRLLDHFQLRGASGPVELSSRKAVALLAYLALQRDRYATRDAAANLLWEDVDTSQARVSLRQAVAALGRAGGGGDGVVIKDTNSLRLSPAVSVDVDTFDRLSRGDAADRDAAIELYRGDLLSGFALRDAPAFNEWLGVAQAHWRQRFIALLLGKLDGSLSDEGDLNAGASAATRLLSVDPYNEHGHRALMRIYMRQGRSPLALSHYRSFADLLRRELSIAPEEETQALYRSLQAGRRERDTVTPPASARTGAAVVPATDPAAPRGPVRIAVVDDEPSLREPVAHYLRQNGFDAVECDGGTALDAAMTTGGIDLVLLDITMPDEDGLQIARRLDPKIRKIMLTSRADVVDRVVGLELGADDYIAKPFHLREILARVRAVLRRT